MCVCVCVCVVYVYMYVLYITSFIYELVLILFTDGWAGGPDDWRVRAGCRTIS